jgi:GGDEF domain-containing protein
MVVPDPVPAAGKNVDMDDEQIDKDAQILALQARIMELEAALEVAHIDAAYAILTRAGIDHRWHRRPSAADTVIFFDIDSIRAHNEQWGYEGTDDRVRGVMAEIGSFWVFRWYSGDEFGLLCAASDSLGFAARVNRLLHEQGMTATFGIAPIVNNDLDASMSRAASLVQGAKATGMRSAILELEHGHGQRPE